MDPGAIFLIAIVVLLAGGIISSSIKSKKK